VWSLEVVKILLINWGIMLALVSLLWVFCTWRKDASIIDRYWGPMCAAPSVLTFIQLEVHSTIALLLVFLLYLGRAAVLAHHAQELECR